MRALALACLLAPAAGAAGALDLGVPIACPENRTCFIQQYVDRDPGPGAQDHACQGLSYDGHKGTDFALATLAQMDEGVDVIAAAPGVVRGTRDGMPDIAFDASMEAAVDGRDCGNGVAIRHENGWETQYCHLRRGSVTVRTGDEVARGDVLGEVGLSGRTQFPHVHISVRDAEGRVVDPFDPDGELSCDDPAAPEEMLWIDPPAYVPGALLDAGFATRVPDYAAVKAGAAAETLRAGAPIVLFGYAFGGRTGDELALRIEGPDGAVLLEDVSRLDKPQAQFFRAAGRRSPQGGWAAGDYRGVVEFRRAGEVISTREVPVTLR